MKRAQGNTIIGATFGCSSRDVSDLRYQSTRTTRAIYAIGDKYYAVGHDRPTDDVGGPWRRHSDQFFASRYGTILWVAEMEGSS
jgi:hypothetical protein